MEKLFKILGFGNLTAEEMQAMMPLMIIVGVILLIVLILIFDWIENARFSAWVKRNSVYDTPLNPWRTIVPWHKTGSKWYLNRLDTPTPSLDRKTGHKPYRMSANTFAIHRAKNSGRGSFGDGSGNSVGR